MSDVAFRAMFARSLDLVWVGLLACAAVAVSFLAGVPTLVRVVVGLPLVLILPGYALTAAVTPRLGRWGADKVVFTLGTSIALAILGGLALNLTSWGLERRSWAVLLAAFTLVAAASAALRRADVRISPPVRRRHAPRTVPLLLLTLAALIAAAALGISRSGAIQANEQSRFTQLSMLPTSGRHDLRIGVTNREGATSRYRMVVHAGARRLATFRTIELGDGATWKRTVQIPADLPPETRIEADLFRASRPGSVYRHVTFWTR